MIDIPVIGKVLGLAVQFGQYVVKSWQGYKSRKEDNLLLSLRDEFRRRVCANAGNCLRPEPGSEQDRRCLRMVARGYLAKDPFGRGYMLAEFDWLEPHRPC